MSLPSSIPDASHVSGILVRPRERATPCTVVSRFVNSDGIVYEGLYPFLGQDQAAIPIAADLRLRPVNHLEFVDPEDLHNIHDLIKVEL